MEFIDLSQISEAEIVETHNEAFSDYEVPMNLSLDTFRYFNRRRGVRYDLSIGAIEDGKLIGFILNAIDIWDGNLTAYDCGTGVVPEFRKKGVGNQIFDELLPILRKEKIKQYLLEVIQTNTAAYNLYIKRNFKITREFDCLQAERVAIEKKLNEDVKKNTIIDFNVRELKSLDWNIARKFWDYNPSWQNSDLSILRVEESFEYLGAFINNSLVGYLVFEQTGGITQLAIHPKHRKKKLAFNLLEMLLNKYPDNERFNIINIDTRDTALLAFLRNFGFKSFTAQYEMKLKL
ncbi:MAG: GNAT family N-acetyltransferase [Promethearchaeota archaeon]